MAKKAKSGGNPNIINLWPTTMLVKRYSHYQKVNPALLELFYQHRDREQRSPSINSYNKISLLSLSDFDYVFFMYGASDDEIVNEMLNKQACKAALIQKTKLRKIYGFVSILMALSISLSGKQTPGGLVVVNMFLLFLFFRLDSDVKLLKLADKLHEKDSPGV